MPQDDFMISKLGSIFHTLACEKDHAEDMQLLLRPRDPSVCYYYLEESLAENRIDHKKWEEEALSVCQKYSLSPPDLLRVISQLLKMRRDLDTLLEQTPSEHLEELCHQFLFSWR